MPKVSILVPVYNVEKYLKQCLDSLITQTLKDIEIICINDGSSDNSQFILEEYANLDKRIILINKENSGYGDSMNKGLEIAKGEYIGIVESDDFASCDMFEKLYTAAKNKDCEIVKSNYFGYLTKNNSSKLVDITYKHKKNLLTDSFEDETLLDIQPSIWSAIYKREFLVNNSINFLTTKGASYQDTSFAFKALTLAQNIFLLHSAYLYYRLDNENSSVNSKEKVYAIVNEFDEIERFLKSKPHLKEFFNSQKLITQFKRYEWNIKRIDKQYREEFINYFSLTFEKYYRNNEIDKKFFSKISKKRFETLINFPKKYQKIIENEIFKDKLKEARKKIISIKLRRNYFSLDILGKKIVEVA